MHIPSAAPALGLLGGKSQLIVIGAAVVVVISIVVVFIMVLRSDNSDDNKTSRGLAFDSDDGPAGRGSSSRDKSSAADWNSGRGNLAGDAQHRPGDFGGTVAGSNPRTPSRPQAPAWGAPPRSDEMVGQAPSSNWGRTSQDQQNWGQQRPAATPGAPARGNQQPDQTPAYSPQSAAAAASPWGDAPPKGDPNSNWGSTPAPRGPAPNWNDPAAAPQGAPRQPNWGPVNDPSAQVQRQNPASQPYPPQNWGAPPAPQQAPQQDWGMPPAPQQPPQQDWGMPSAPQQPPQQDWGMPPAPQQPPQQDWGMPPVQDPQAGWRNPAGPMSQPMRPPQQPPQSPPQQDWGAPPVQDPQAGWRQPPQQGPRGNDSRIAYIIVREGKEVGRTYDLRKERITIGRSRDSDIFLEDLAVSRLNSTIYRNDQGEYVVRDEDSANGTSVNGQLLPREHKEHHLSEGDEIRVGQTLMVFTRR